MLRDIEATDFYSEDSGQVHATVKLRDETNTGVGTLQYYTSGLLKCFLSRAHGSQLD
jgi:hypothetical protein